MAEMKKNCYDFLYEWKKDVTGEIKASLPIVSISTPVHRSLKRKRKIGKWILRWNIGAELRIQLVHVCVLGLQEKLPA